MIEIPGVKLARTNSGLNESAVASWQKQVFIVSRDPVAGLITHRMLAEAELQTRQFQTPRDLLQALPLPSPGCYLIDFILPDMTGLQLMRILREADSYLPCIFTSTRADPDLIASAMTSGAFGFMKKPYQQIELLEMVQRALSRNQAMCGMISTVLRYRELRLALSSRELQVVENLELGYSAIDVGKTLNISPRTVENQRVQILKKLELRNSTELIKQAAILNTLRACGVLP